MRTTTRHLVLAGAALVGAATATTSAISLYGIAVKCGIPEPWAVANPIALDAGAAVAALAWITQVGERREWGKRTAVGALAASLVENGIDHAVTSGLLPVTLWLVLGVSACIPAMLFAVVHLAALMVRPETATEEKRGERAPRKPTTKLRVESSVGTPTPPVVPTEPTPRGKKLSPQEWARANWPKTAKEIELATGVSKGYSFKIRDAVRAEIEQAS